MTGEDQGQITQLLGRWQDKDPAAFSLLVEEVYEELCMLARNALRNERKDHTYTPTALVHEAYMKLEANELKVAFEDRGHFFAIVARVMRHILVSYARQRNADKRTGKLVRVELDEMDGPQHDPFFITAVDDALEVLHKKDPTKAKIVELRFFAGLSIENTAEILKMTPAGVFRQWQDAKEIMRDHMLDA